MPAARLFTANPPQRFAREQPSVWCRHPDQGLYPLSPAASLACAQHVEFKPRSCIYLHNLMAFVDPAECIIRLESSMNGHAAFGGRMSPAM